MPKKRKVEEETPSSWRIKCIETFNLKPVPEAWKDGVAVGTESAWKTYFEYRTSEEEASSKQARGGEDYHGDEGESYIMKMWKEKMNWTKSSDEWLSWTPKVWDLSFEDEDELRTAEYIGHIWSPYVLPHALRLRHFYHCRYVEGVPKKLPWSMRKGFVLHESFLTLLLELATLRSSFLPVGTTK